MKTIKAFTDLNAWKESHKFVLEVYSLTTKFPAEEKFGITSQITRAALSITCNIADGFSRQSKKEKVQFYYISKGSLSEVQNLLLTARDLKIH